MYMNETGLEFELVEAEEKRKHRGRAALMLLGMWFFISFILGSMLTTPGTKGEDFAFMFLVQSTVGTLLFFVGLIYTAMWTSSRRKVNRIKKFLNMKRGERLENAGR